MSYKKGYQLGVIKYGIKGLRIVRVDFVRSFNIDLFSNIQWENCFFTDLLASAFDTALVCIKNML